MGGNTTMSAPCHGERKLKMAMEKCSHYAGLRRTRRVKDDAIAIATRISEEQWYAIRTSMSCTCWCLLSKNLDASRQCGVCSQRCLIKHDGWRYTYDEMMSVLTTRTQTRMDLRAAFTCEDCPTFLPVPCRSTRHPSL